MHAAGSVWLCPQSGSYTRKLMEAAVALLRPGGRLVFSTCTVSPREWLPSRALHVFI